jgi:hypothetical protein
MNLGRARYSPITLLHARTHIMLLAMSHTLLSSAWGETLICRWVDEKGRTQIADAVPDRYASVATCTDPKQYELIPGQLRDAAQRQAAERSKALRDRVKSPKKVASSASRPMGAASQPRAKRPGEVVNDATDCATWWRIYDESGECFGPYKTLRGIRPEAFDNCNEVPSPEPKCGLRSN